MKRSSLLIGSGLPALCSDLPMNWEDQTRSCVLGLVITTLLLSLGYLCKLLLVKRIICQHNCTFLGIVCKSVVNSRLSKLFLKFTQNKETLSLHP